MDPVKHGLFILFILLPCLLPQEEEGMTWEAGRRLTWADFRGIPPDSRRVAATTASGISYWYNTKGPAGRYRLEYEVTALFYPQQSWYHRELCDSIVLGHEQLHFDITELYARRMRAMLDRETFGPNVKAEVRRLFKKLNGELSEFQARYDRETDFSRDREAQGRWNAKIAGKLLETEQN